MRFLLSFLLLAAPLLAQTTAPAAPAAGPAVRVQVVVGIAQKRLGDSYRKEMTVTPKATVEGVSRITALPAFDAIMLIVTMDTRAKYVRGQEAFSVHSAQTMPMAEAPNGNLRGLDFEDFKLTFDSYRDASNIGGAVYKYYVFGLVDATTKAIVNFQTNDPQLASFCKLHPEKRDEMLKLGKGAKYPATFK